MYDINLWWQLTRAVHLTVGSVPLLIARVLCSQGNLVYGLTLIRSDRSSQQELTVKSLRCQGVDRSFWWVNQVSYTIGCRAPFRPSPVPVSDMVPTFTAEFTPYIYSLLSTINGRESAQPIGNRCVDLFQRNVWLAAGTDAK